MSPTEVMDVRLLRFQALFRLRMFDELSSEIMRLGDLENAPLSTFAWSPLAVDGEPDITRDATGAKPERPSAAPIPIDVRILSSEVHVMTGRADEGVQQLTQLLQRLRKGIASPAAANADVLTANVDTATLSQWARRVAMSLVNAFVRQHRWRLALATLNEIYDDLPGGDEAGAAAAATGAGADDIASNGRPAQLLISYDMNAVVRTKAMLLLRMARIFLQIGGVDAAKQCLNQAKNVAANVTIDAASGSNVLQSHFELVEGLIALVEDDVRSPLCGFDSGSAFSHLAFALKLGFHSLSRLRICSRKLSSMRSTSCLSPWLLVMRFFVSHLGMWCCFVAGLGKNWWTARQAFWTGRRIHTCQAKIFWCSARKRCSRSR